MNLKVHPNALVPIRFWEHVSSLGTGRTSPCCLSQWQSACRCLKFLPAVTKLNSLLETHPKDLHRQLHEYIHTQKVLIISNSENTNKCPLEENSFSWEWQHSPSLACTRPWFSPQGWQKGMAGIQRGILRKCCPRTRSEKSLPVFFSSGKWDNDVSLPGCIGNI